MRLRTFGHTDIGRVRPENEDSFLCDDGLRLYAVADGIGGLPAGKQASELAVRALLDIIQSATPATRAEYLRCLDEVNASVFQLGRALNSRLGIGTTLTVAHFTGPEMRVLHVGDSSLLRLRSGTLEKITVDHTLENEMQERLARGESPLLLLENRQALTRCVGQPPPLVGDYTAHPLQAGDRYVLCSDGISRTGSLRVLEVLVRDSETPEVCVRTLIDHANSRGGFDNATAVVVFVDSLD
jgi:protein phosphatase